MSDPVCADCGEPISRLNDFHVTVKQEGVELEGVVRGYVALREFADAVKPLGWFITAHPMEGHDHD